MKIFVSVILPIKNEFSSIKQTLDSILNQTYPGNLIEIIIADGMSVDGTRGIIKKYQKLYSKIHLIDNIDEIVPTGFNRALNLSKGEIIVRVDGHCVISNDYIENCVKLLNQKNASNVGGIMNPKGLFFIDQIVSIATSSRFGIGNSKFHYSKIGQWADTVYMGCWSRVEFEKNGGFDEELIRNQDDEFNFRLIQNGGKIWLDPSIKSIYYPRNKMTKLFSQYFQYGFYKVRVLQKRGSFASIRHLVPLIFVISIFLSIAVAPITSLPMYLIFVIYSFANLTTTFTKFKKPYFDFLGIFFMLPITFFVLHFSYGFGFLTGLFKFWDKWKDTDLKDSLFDRDSFIKTNNYK